MGKALRRLRRLITHYSLLTAFAAFAALLPAAPVHAATRITQGPYLQDATTTGVSVLWHTDTAAAPAVDYRPSGTGDAQWRTVSLGDRSRVAALTITGLEPGTAYQYRVRGDGEVLYSDGTFRTLPAASSQNLDFLVYGDNRTNHSPHADVVRRMQQERPAPELLIHTGDMVEHGGSADEWSIFFEIERNLRARTAAFPASGNHEDNAPLYFEQFHVPSNGTNEGKGRWYSFDAGPAHFVALDVVFSDVDPGTPQYQWLDADLARSNQPWKFIYFHYPPYNASTPHGPNIKLRAALENLFLVRKVSAVFTGHAHIYERAAGAGSPPLTYFVSGGGGAPQHTVGLEPWTRYTEQSYHYLRLQIRGNRLTSVGVRADGSEFDRVEGQLNADGRMATTGTEARPVVVAGISVAQYLGSSRGVLLGIFMLLTAVVAPGAIAIGIGGRRAPVVPVPSGAVHVRGASMVDPYGQWRGVPVLGVAVGVTLILIVGLGASAPLRWLVGFDSYTMLLTAHAVSGVAVLVVAAAAGNYGYRLAAHRAPTFSFLAANAAGAAVLSAASAILGNVLYARYIRSGGPMEELIRKAPEVHRTLFEFKEFSGLVPLPIAVAAAFIIFRYREDLRRDRHLAELVALLLLLLAFYCLFPLGLGLS